MLTRFLRMSYYGIQLIKYDKNIWKGLKILIEVTRETQELNVFTLWTKLPLINTFPAILPKNKKKKRKRERNFQRQDNANSRFFFFFF